MFGNFLKEEPIMQSIVNIATAKNTVKPVAEQPSVPVKKGRVWYISVHTIQSPFR